MKQYEIIKLYKLRNEQAITETEKKYGAYCKKIAYNILNDTRDIEECMNDTYLKVWNSIPPEEPESLVTYIGRIVRNTSLDIYRRKRAKKRGAGEMELILEELEECCGNCENEPGKLLEEKEMTELINAYLEKLSKLSRDIFINRYWYARTIKEISEMYGLNENTVKSRLYQTRVKLRDYLETEEML